MNKVDELEKEIQDIRLACIHSFEIVKFPILVESLVKGVYLGTITGSTKKIGIPHGNSFTLMCSLCSLKRDCSVIKICPLCYSTLVKDTQPLNGLEEFDWSSRLQYFGMKHIYYSVILSRCPNKDFTIASDEWVQ